MRSLANAAALAALAMTSSVQALPGDLMDIYDDWDGDGSFVEAFDKAMASDAAIAASGRQS